MRNDIRLGVKTQLSKKKLNEFENKLNGVLGHLDIMEDLKMLVSRPGSQMGLKSTPDSLASFEPSNMVHCLPVSASVVLPTIFAPSTIDMSLAWRNPMGTLMAPARVTVQIRSRRFKRL